MVKAVYRTGIASMLLFVFFPYAGMAQLAPGVQQSAAQTATVTGLVTQSDGTPIEAAEVRLIGPAMLSTKSDVQGTFTFTSVPYGIYQIRTIASGFGIATHDKIVVKGDMSVAIQYVAKNTAGEFKEIAHVLTRSAGAQINVTPASIASINPRDYAFQGNTSWRELLNQIPGVTVGGSFYGGSTQYAVIPDSPFEPVVLSVNGALPYETSTTLDGMPLVNTSLSALYPGSGTNLSYLPMTLFDTADVVRGPGADAPSIVDSIGGSFVLHAPGRIDQNQFEFSISNDPYGGVVSNAKAALRFGRFSAALVYGVNNSPGPLGNTKGIMAITRTPVTINGQAFAGCGTFAFFSDCSSSPVDTATYQACNCQYQDALLLDGAPFNTAWGQHNGAISLSYDITPSVTAQVFYVGSSSNSPISFPGYAVDFVPGPNYAGSITPGSHNYLDAGGPDAIAQAASLFEEKLTGYVGHGVLRLAALQNNSFTQLSEPNIEPDGQYTLYGTGYYAADPATPVNFNGTSAYLTFFPFTYNAHFWVNNRDLLLSYATQLGTRSSAGISYVTSYYNDPDWYQENLPSFGLSISSSAPTAVSETTREMRFHFGTEISDKLSLDASWYVAQASYHVLDPASPSTWTDSRFPYSAPRFGMVWRVNRNAVIRIAAGGGYAVPQISYLVGTNGAIFCTGTCSETLTNLNLKPEQSFGFDLGSDIRLQHDTVLSVDLYRTNLFGQFFQSANLAGTYLGLPLYITEYGNLGQSRYEGVNLDIRHDVTKGMYWHGALGLTRAYVVSVPTGFYDTAGCTNCTNTYIVPNINFDGEFQLTVPYAGGTAQIGYRWAPGKYIDLSPTYYGNGNPYFEPAFIEFDAHAGYSLTKNVSLLATFRNITGIYGQNYQYLNPSMGAPTVSGLPFALFGVPYGPRSVIVTASFKQ